MQELFGARTDNAEDLPGVPSRAVKSVQRMAVAPDDAGFFTASTARLTKDLACRHSAKTHRGLCSDRPTHPDPADAAPALGYRGNRWDRVGVHPS